MGLRAAQERALSAMRSVGLDSGIRWTGATSRASYRSGEIIVLDGISPQSNNALLDGVLRRLAKAPAAWCACLRLSRRAAPQRCEGEITNLRGQGQGLVALGVLVWRCDVCVSELVTCKVSARGDRRHSTFAESLHLHARSVRV